MAQVAEKYASQLKRIKKNIDAAYVYFKENNDRFHEFQRFVFETALTEGDEDTLMAMGKPVIEFNITNAPISRLCGEWSKQEPSINVTAEVGEEVDEQTIKVVEGHLRHILLEAKRENTEYNIFKDQLSGGFSCYKLTTDYANEMSFDQVIKVSRVYDPTMTLFDSNARLPDKSDAEFCVEIFPQSKKSFESENPDIDLSNINFGKYESSFNWSYSLDKDDIVVVADYYEVKKRKKRIVKLANNKVMTTDDYDKFIEDWKMQGYIEVPPAIVGEPRTTMLQVICRYRLIGSQVIDYIETDFEELPLIFVDGDSVIIRGANNGQYKQFTKPYVFHAKGLQRLTNFSGQVIGNDFENMVMHKFKVAEESLPTQELYLSAYDNPQKANVLVYKQYNDQNPDQPLNPPMEIARIGLPPEVVAVFNNSMQMLQNILGSYDASLGINDNQLSGIAIVEGATQSNAAAMPYVVAHMQSLTRLANNIVSILPKYYVTPRTIPVVDREGKRSYQKINQPGGVSFNYDSNDLNVRVEAGVSFAIAKNQALQQIIALSQTSELFKQFIAEEGLDILLDNMEFRGVDIVKERAEKWMVQLKQKMAQQQQQPNPMMLQQMAAMQKMKQDGEIAQADQQLKAQDILVSKQKADNDRLAILMKAGESADKVVIAERRAEAEERKAEMDLGLRHLDMKNEHAHKAIKLMQDMNKPKETV